MAYFDAGLMTTFGGQATLTCCPAEFVATQSFGRVSALRPALLPPDVVPLAVAPLAVAPAGSAGSSLSVSFALKLANTLAGT